jgi:hypothetical protein
MSAEDDPIATVKVMIAAAKKQTPLPKKPYSEYLLERSPVAIETPVKVSKWKAKSKPDAAPAKKADPAPKKGVKGIFEEDGWDDEPGNEDETESED